MRLLNVSTGALEEFYDKSPPYAILSHTWGTEEVSLGELSSIPTDVFQGFVYDTSYPDINTPQPMDRHKTIVSRKGFQKIAWTCCQAARDSIAYAWIDTCCIDKKSSSELSEAINS
jgi:hypothetical protein